MESTITGKNTPGHRNPGTEGGAQALNTGAIPKTNQTAKKTTTGQSGAPDPVVAKSKEMYDDDKGDRTRRIKTERRGERVRKKVSIELPENIHTDDEEAEGVLAPPNTPQEICSGDANVDSEHRVVEVLDSSDDESTGNDTIVEKELSMGVKRPRNKDDSYERLFAGNRSKTRLHSTPEKDGPNRIPEKQNESGSGVKPQETLMREEPWYTPSLAEDVKLIEDWVATGANQVQEAWRRIVQAKLCPTVRVATCQVALDDEIVKQSIKEAKKQCKEPKDAVMLSKRSWPASAYTCTIVKEGQILDDPDAGINAVLGTKEKLQTNQESKDLVKRIPVLKKILDEDKIEPGKTVVVSSRQVVVIEESGKTDAEVRQAYVLGNIDGDINQQSELIYAVTCRLADAATECRNRVLAIAINGDVAPIAARKIIDTALTGTGVTGIFYSNAEKVSKRSYAGAIKKSKAVVIDIGDKGYADTLRDLKKELTGKLDFGLIKKCRKTKQGGILLDIKGDARQTEEVAAIVAANKIGLKSRLAGKAEKAILYDLDITISVAEVEEALRAKGFLETTVTKMTTARDSTQIAVLAVRGSDVSKARAGATIRVGWCDGHLKYAKERCYRCWETGHIAKSCKAPSEQIVCRDCRRTGHTRKECPRGRERERSLTHRRADAEMPRPGEPVDEGEEHTDVDGSESTCSSHNLDTEDEADGRALDGVAPKNAGSEGVT